MHSNWPAYLRLLLYLHIACGGLAFVCAPVALATAKGGKAHRRWGKIYFWAMAAVAATALALSLMLPVWFLAMVSVFSFYAAFSEYRVLYLKDLYRAGRAKPLDWVAAWVTMISSALLLAMGIIRPGMMGVGVIRIAGRPVSIVAMVFGAIGMRLAWRAMQTFARRPQEKMFWWYEHLQGMIGSYIAAMTAFSAVNLSHWFGAAWWVWLWPTMIGVPAIAVWTAYYRRKFAGRKAAVPVSG